MFMSRNLQSVLPASFSDRRGKQDRRSVARHNEAILAALEAHRAIFELAPDGKVAAAGDALCDLLGLSADQVKGRPHAALLVDAEQRSARAKAFAEQVARGAVAEATLAHVTRDGGAVVLRLIATPVRIDGALAGALVLATDVTEAARPAARARRAVQSIDAVSVAVMTVDRDFIITGVNRPTKALLEANESNFRKLWPGFEAGKIIGMCIDTFHANPAHQRRMLADPSRLPFRTDITVGDLKFALTVNASYDEDGNYDGNILEWMDVTTLRTEQGQLAAIDRSQAMVEFSLDGRVMGANANFLAALGYTLDEIKGQHHSIFVDRGYSASNDYKLFWEKLGRGEFEAGRYKRLGKDGRDVWIQATYNPVLDQNGRPFRVVKYATVVTALVEQEQLQRGQLDAIDRAQGVIEFDLTGHVLAANANFLGVLGYTLDEIRGQHHSLFVESSYRLSVDYKAFWDKLARGDFDAGRYKRIGKGGREVWIQASYNPVFDAGGKPFRVVKYATDITTSVLAEQALERAVNETQAIVAAAQANDLSRRIDLEGKSGRIASLCEGVNGMLDTMSGIMATLSESCGTISVAAREIAMGNTDLSQRTEEQASSLEETSASMEQLTGTVRQNADNAQQANKLAASASEIATRGGQVVSEVVRTMDGITQSSRKISDIIGVIDEIAFQTNILALNAAVEAARAGEQGRGFAVVAAEVRSLAQRSANAAKEIKALISDSVDKVDSGSKLVASAGSTMEEIVTSVRRVTDIMAEISAASQEQSSGLDQVNTAVSQMDKITQQNAALVEEAAAAAKSMEEQADGLLQLVSAFVLAEGEIKAPSVLAPTSARKQAPAKPAAKRREPVKAREPAAEDWSEF